MASFVDCVIDTEPMAHKIDSVSGHLQGTTAAVIGMKAAVIQAEEEAANHVCNNVNKGFYTLIHSQISQKIAKLHSEVDSHVMKLNQLTKQLHAVKKRMERDYSMVTTRYVRLFNGINKNLEQRVSDLDRPVIDFIQKDAAKISNRSIQLVATVPVSQLESVMDSQKIIASNLKYRGMKAINAMTNFLEDMNEQDDLTRHILLDKKLSAEKEEMLIPIIVSESEFDNLGNKQMSIYISSDGISPNSQREISNAADARLQNVEWRDEDVSAEIKSEFAKMLEESNLSDRIRKMTEELFYSHSFQTIKPIDHEL